MAAIEAFGSVAWQPLLPQTASPRQDNQTPEKSAADDLTARIGPAYKVDISRKDDAGDWNDDVGVFQGGAVDGGKRS